MKMNKKMLGLLGMGHAVTDVNQGALPMMLAFLQPVFALSQLQVGIVILAFNLSSSVIQPLFGILSDRLRAVWLIPTGCLLAGLGMAFTGFSPNYYALLLAALASGLGVAAYHPEGSKVARFASGERKASGMSLFSVGGNIGFAAGPVLVSLLVGWAGLTGSAGFFALNGAMALLLWIYLARYTPPPSPAANRKAREQEGASPLRPAGVNFVYLALPVFLLVLVVIMRSWVHFGMVTFLPQYYINYLHQSEAYAATLTSIFLFAGAAGTLAGGPAADRWGLKPVIMGSMALLIPLLYLFTVLSGFWVTILVAVAGFAVISTFAVTVVFGQELLPNNVGLASGLLLGFAIGMGGIGTTLLGWVADTWGLPAVFRVMMFFPVAGLVLTFFLPDRETLERRKEKLAYPET